MIASQEINVQISDAVKICHSAFLLFLAVKIVFAGVKVSTLRSPSGSYNARFVTFSYFSFSAWILWIVQYAILAAPFLTLPRNASLIAVLWLGLVQNALWTTAALFLTLKSFSRKSLILPLAVFVAIVVALIAYEAGSWSLPQLNAFVVVVDGVWNAVIFIVIGISIDQLKFGKGSAETFITHAWTQWIWGLLWFSTWGTTLAVQLAFPVWRIFLFIVWSNLILAMAKSIEPTEEKIAQVAKQHPLPDIQLPKTPDLLVTFKVMISSTVEDLGPEREAVDRAISGLNLTRFRAETIGSFAHPPDMICAFMAERCDIFVLIIGERYGYTIMSREMSVVEFEYEVARGQNRGKILVYIKEGVTRDPRLEPFVKRVEDFEDGYFRTLFRTPEELEKKVHDDIQRWILQRAIAQGLQEFDRPPNSH